MKILQIGFAYGLILLVHACAAPTGGGPAADTGSGVTKATYTPQAGLSDQQRFREVLNFLEDGEPRPARVELMVYLDAHPDSVVAGDLLRQIDLSALDYFPEDYEEIELASGQSLSTLSQSYLGSLYQFHALAKYNGIAEPRSIKVGQTIRIPLTRSARVAFADKPDSSADAVNERAPGLAIPPVEKSMPVAAPVVSASNSEEQLADRADDLYRQAVNAFRSQDLDKAISLWDQVLEIDDDYENARLQRSQAIELKNKLSNLN